jgi:choline-glycine betaine transporter
MGAVIGVAIGAGVLLLLWGAVVLAEKTEPLRQRISDWFTDHILWWWIGGVLLIAGVVGYVVSQIGS